MEFAQYITHGTGGFLVLGAGLQPQFGHGIDNTPLHRFKPIANGGQGPVHNDVHGVVQVGLFREGLQGLALHPFKIHFNCFTHVTVSIDDSRDTGGTSPWMEELGLRRDAHRDVGSRVMQEQSPGKQSMIG